MNVWIVVALVGGLLSILGFAGLVRRYSRGEVRGRYLAACVVGFASLVVYAVSSALRPEAITGPVALAILAPAAVAIVVIIRERGRGPAGSA